MIRLDKPYAPTKCMLAKCPRGAQRPEPENILKTKGQKRPFLYYDPENVLKRKLNTKIHGNKKMA
jgi:hypothetical protein